MSEIRNHTAAAQNGSRFVAVPVSMTSDAAASMLPGHIGNLGPYLFRHGSAGHMTIKQSDALSAYNSAVQRL